MNKLVSKNPIQRFKLGQKIEKLQDGGWAGYYTPGNWPKSERKSSYPISPSYIESQGAYNRQVTQGKRNYKEDMIPIWQREQQDTNKPISYKTSDGKVIYFYKGQGWFDSNGNKYNWKVGPTKQQAKQQAKSSTNVTRNRPAKTKVINKPLKTEEQWQSEYNNALNGLSQSQKEYLDSLGIDMTSAETMQKGINAYNNNSGLVVDNKWGNNSKNALSAILSKMPSNYRNEIPQEVIVETPNYGYRTNNTYEGNDFYNRMKSMGIRSNADLIDFMYRNNGKTFSDDWTRQFHSDVNKALGGDYSDANVRKVFGTNGTWGKAFMGSGDYTDFQKTLQTNAGIWNGTYDAKELAARTGNDGIVYSSLERKKLFDKYNKPSQTTILGNNNFNYSYDLFKPVTWSDNLSNQLMQNTNYYNPSYKKGGSLISKNAIERFKQKNFR